MEHADCAGSCRCRVAVVARRAVLDERRVQQDRVYRQREFLAGADEEGDPIGSPHSAFVTALPTASLKTAHSEADSTGTHAARSLGIRARISRALSSDPGWVRANVASGVVPSSPSVARKSAKGFGSTFASISQSTAVRSASDSMSRSYDSESMLRNRA